MAQKDNTMIKLALSFNYHKLEKSFPLNSQTPHNPTRVEFPGQ